MRRATLSPARILVLWSLARLAGPAHASSPVDDVVLHLDRGTSPGEVRLLWTGGVGPFTIFRSTSPIDVTNPFNAIGTAGGGTSVDLPPTGSVFYAVRGTSCASDAGCPTGHCVDAVCCDTACTGDCLRCDLAGSLGTCASVPIGTDPDDDCPIDPPATCGRTGQCSGAGPCALYAAGATCASQSCASSTSLNLADLCDGAGTCVDGGVQSCPADTCGPYTACNYQSFCANSATRTRTCTPHVCSNGACVDGTPYVQTDSAGCQRNMTGERCGATSTGCPPNQTRDLCCSASGVCNTTCSPCSP